MIFKALCLVSLLYVQTYANPQTCITDNDCEQTLMVRYKCVANQCQQVCASDFNCPQDYNCVNGACFMVQTQPIVIAPIVQAPPETLNQQPVNQVNNQPLNQQQSTQNQQQPAQQTENQNPQQPVQQQKPKMLSGRKIGQSKRPAHRHEHKNQQSPNALQIGQKNEQANQEQKQKNEKGQQKKQKGWIKLKNPHLRQFANEIQELDQQIEKQSEELKKMKKTQQKNNLNSVQQESQSHSQHAQGQQSSSNHQNHQHVQGQQSSTDHQNHQHQHQHQANQKNEVIQNKNVNEHPKPITPTQILCSSSLPCPNNKVCVQGSCQSCQSDSQCPNCGQGYLSFCSKGSCRCVLNCSQLCIEKCNTGVSYTQYEVPKCGNLCSCETCSNNEQCKFLKSLGKCQGEAICSNGVCDCEGNNAFH